MGRERGGEDIIQNEGKENKGVADDGGRKYGDPIIRLI